MTPIDYYGTFGLQDTWDEVYERSAYPVDTNLKFRWLHPTTGRGLR